MRSPAALRRQPAGVCLLEKPATAEWMQHVAAEMNVAETAFVVPGDKAFGLRWFTPTVEVGLCGHATLASAHALGSGACRRRGDRVRDAERDPDGGAGRQRPAGSSAGRRVMLCPMPDGLVEALGATPRAVTATVQGGTAHGNVLVEFGDEAEVRSLTPRFDRLRAMPFGVIATARAAHAPYDFVSRYFASPYGIDEDPVTGGAHCSLAPYWADQLKKHSFLAWQASARGGELQVTLQGERVRLAGHAITVLRGEFIV
jgi:predicted PhzF superfamily epimerase YddE/YHI9